MRLIWLIIAATFICENLTAAPLTPQSFIDSYLARTGVYQSAKIQTEISEAEVLKAGDWYRSTLKVKPTWVSKEARYLSQNLNISSSSSSVDVELMQALPPGTELLANVSSSVANPDVTTTGIVDRSYTFALAQPLYRNAFGRMWRMEKNAAKAQLESDRSSFKLQKLKSCMAAADSYDLLWLTDERLKLFEQMASTSQSALNVAESSARARLIRRLDLLSARSDHLKAQSQVTRALSEKQKALTTVQAFVAVEAGPAHLQNPDAWYSRPLSQPTSADLASNPSLQASLMAVQAAQGKSAVAREKARSQVNLVLEGGRSEGRVPLNTGVSRYNEDFVRAGLSIEFPLRNKANDADIKSAALMKARAQWEYDDLKREAETGFAQRLFDLKAIQDQLENSKKRAVLYEDQRREAFGLIRSGRIEFEDYLRYRDLSFNEGLQILELSESFWRQKRELALLTGQEAFLCGVGT